MKLMRFLFEGKEHLGVLEDNRVHEIGGTIYAAGKKTGKAFSVDQIRFLPPVSPNKIVCIGFNYRAHAEELSDIATKKPTLTLKSQNAAVGCGDPIILPKESRQVEHEAELGIVIGKGGYRIKEPRKHILGYTVVNDVTARDLEREMTQWSASKSFPSFCPIGPCVDTGVDPSDLRITCRVNGKIRQDSRTSLMIYGPEKAVSFVSRFMKLERGDLIATGTVPGVGVLSAGDLVEVEIEKIGVLRSPVQEE
jgi:2-keto-4-pentenoate hydratase/2-oxohepta-3-ene-1,7-dioic acid hydratase in catechol pathway